MTPDIPVAALREIVELDHASGLLTWLERPLRMFKDARACKSWNTRFAGKPAFNTLSGNGYMHGGLFDKKVYTHRVIFALANDRWPTQSVDHIDGNRLNNRPSNLRDVDHRTNCLNQPTSKANTSGFTGVSFDKSRDSFEAYLTESGKKVSLGRFSSVSDAAAARTQANQTHGFHANHGRKSS